MSHACTDCGLVHELPGQLPLDYDAGPAAAAPVIEAPPGPNENDVAIAKIEADARVKTEQLYAESRDQDLAAELERVRGELAGLRAGMELGSAAADAAPPAGPPIVVEPPAPAAEPAPMPPPPAEEPPAPKKEKKSTNYFGF